MKAGLWKRVLCAGLILALTACGLDSYIYFYPVNQIVTWPSSSDDSLNYFSFKTRDAMNSSSVYFRGFEILYRIYNNSTDRAADVSAITTYNSNNPALTYSYLLTTKSYVRMNAQSRVGSYPLIPGDSSDRTVTIRLVPYGSYAASFTVGSDPYGIALRTIDGSSKSGDASYTFTYDTIKSGNSDVKNGTWDDSSDKKWYVQAFVLAYGYDETFKPIYSEACNLGFVTIRD